MGKSLKYGYGLIDYDDESDHILVRYPLTSNDVAGHGGATVIGTGASTFDSEFGYKPYYTDGTSNAPANGYLKWDASINPLIPVDQVYRIMGGYTIGFDVQTEHLFTLLHNLVLCTMNPVTAAKEVRALINAVGQVQMNNSTRALLNVTSTVFLLQADRHPDDDFVTTDYTTVRYSISTGGKCDVFFGHKWMLSGEFASALVSDANPLKVFTLGGYSGGETFPGYMKRLFVVDQTVLLPWDKSIGSIACIGDSITQGQNTGSNTNIPFDASYYGSVAVANHNDYSLPHEIHRRLSEVGRYVKPYVFGVSGSKIYNNGTRILWQIDGTNSANARDHRPHVLTCGGGTNDARELADMTDSGGISFGAGYREILDEALSWGCLKLFVFANIPAVSNSPDYVGAEYLAAVQTGNATIEALRDEYVVAYPDVKFEIADRYTALGGANPNPDYFIAGDLHLNNWGAYIQAKVIAEAIISSEI